MPRTLAQNATYIKDTIKPAIKSAIEAQGVTVPSTDSFLDYADRIGEIEGGGSGYQLKDLPTGSISTVNDAAELPLNALKVSVEAVQDLHGYDYPWAGGAGKNKLPNPIAETKSDNGITVTTDVNGNYDVSGTATSDAMLIFDLINDYTIPIAKYQGGNGIMYLFNNQANSNVQVYFYYNNTVIDYWGCSSINRVSDSYSGQGGRTINKIGIKVLSGASVSNNFSLSPMFINDGVQATAFTPYSNICPISGWDSGEIVNKSRNLVTDKNDYMMTIAPNTDTTTTAFSISVQAGKTYTISCYQDNSIPTSVRNTLQVGVNGTNLYETDAGRNNYHQEAGTHKVTFTANSDQICYVRYWGNALSVQSTYSQWQIEENSDFTMYQPYWTPQEYTLNFPQTIYGAEWDVIDGELGLKITDGFYSSYNGETLPGVWMSDRDVYQEGTTPTIGAQVKYKLATPIYITLTGLSIRMLQGTNNLYADCGEVIEGEYFVDEGAIDVRKVDYQIGSSGSIKTTDGRVLSGFASMNGYHSRPLDASGNWLDVDWSKDFEIGVAFKFTALPNYQGITGDGNANSYRKAPRIYYDNSEGKLALCVSSDGSTLAIDTFLNHTFVVDKWYFIKAKFVLSTMTFSVDITEDFSTFTSLYSGVMASAPYHNTASLCFGGDAQQSNMASNTFLIDTFNTYIKGDNVSWGAFTGAFPS